LYTFSTIEPAGLGGASDMVRTQQLVLQPLPELVGCQVAQVGGDSNQGSDTGIYLRQRGAGIPDHSFNRSIQFFN
jgi:hypothetical protein